MKVLVIGCNGQLGSDVVETFKCSGDAVVALSHSDADVRDYDTLERCIRSSEPEIVVNTAALHRLEECEEKPGDAFAVNAIGPRNLALLSLHFNFKLVHFSTDYVFDGKKGSPYVEEDAPSPLNVYGNSKLAGEYFVRTISQKYFVIRISALFGKHPCRAKGGLNFVQGILKRAREEGEVRVVDDELVSPTYTVDVAEQLVNLVRTECYGLYHSTSQGECSWYEFAKMILELGGERARLFRASPGDFRGRVARPKYSVLENKNLQKIGLDFMPHWRNALGRYLAQATEGEHCAAHAF